jgi:hypothetical protein
MARQSTPGENRKPESKDPKIESKAQSKKTRYLSAEIGSVGLFEFDGSVRDNIVPQLSGARGRLIYGKMRADATVSAIIFAIEMMLRRSTWSCVPKDPQDEKAMEYAQFFDSLRDDMVQTWEHFISNVLSMLTYGWSFFEIVAKRRMGLEGPDPSVYDDGMWGIKKLAYRTQDTLDGWKVSPNGDVEAMVQQIYFGPHAGKFVIPMEKGLLFRAGYWQDSPEGISPLRGAFEPWELLQGINRAEAYGIERELNGLPVIKLPADMLKAAKEGDAEAAHTVRTYTQVVRDVRLNKQAGVLIPSDYYENADGTMTHNQQYEFSLLSSNGTRAINVQAAAERHQVSIARCVLADFLMLGTTSRSGSQALGQGRFQFFADALDGWNASIADTLNRYLIPRVAAMNGMQIDILPIYKVESVSPVDVETLTNCMERYIRAGGVLLPDTKVDAEIRELLGLPPLDPERMKEMEEYDPTLDPRNPRYRDPNAVADQLAIQDAKKKPTTPGSKPTAQGDRGQEGGAPKHNNNARKKPSQQNKK